MRKRQVSKSCLEELCLPLSRRRQIGGKVVISDRDCENNLQRLLPFDSENYSFEFLSENYSFEFLSENYSIDFLSDKYSSEFLSENYRFDSENYSLDFLFGKVVISAP